ncbi:TetR family transcriptional regulator [Haloactinospora alba]|uniref:TetR family transcriptional regulator n=1 Tax=Haloactinospora alba TaxID=405555 RepID=A0A543NND5_9ACTN|nr:TetR/AcrR family transcriptional regulator [Haloactinospora alba]TQN33335.1 TetR family transcriptional regulator [Haloactinospora alba]
MVTSERELSTADARRAAVVSSAVRLFARSGLSGATIGAIADDAGISPAYVFKLFSSKNQLFVAALESCYEQILGVLEDAAAGSDTAGSADVLDRMGAAYAELIADRDLLNLQVHAQAAVGVPEVRDAVRSGIARITALASSRSGGSAGEVQRFMAYGQLCHLLTAVDAFGVDERWAATLTEGVRHTAPAEDPRN